MGTMIARTACLAPLLLCLAGPAAAQTGDKVYRLAELAPSAISAAITREETLPELARLGFAEGRNLVVDERAGENAEMEGLARELLRAKPDVVVAIGPEAIIAAAASTKTVPIV